jgi:CheY-like chemotaxis protein
MKVLFMSGYSGDIVEQQNQQSGCIEYIQKPFTSLSLLQQVKTILGNGSN